MAFDAKYLSETQKKHAEKIIEAVKKEFNLRAPDYTIMGLNPWKGIKEMEESEGVKLVFENKEIAEEVKVIKKYADIFLKVKFYLESPLKELIFIASCEREPKHNAVFSLWDGILEFSTEEQIVFGRIGPEGTPKHGGGDYLFAPLHLPIPNIQSLIDMVLRPEDIDPFLASITQANNNLDLFDRIREGEEAKFEMRETARLIKAKSPLSSDLITHLNENKSLVKLFQSIGHYGAMTLRGVKVPVHIDLWAYFTTEEILKLGNRRWITVEEIGNIISDHAKEMKIATAKMDKDIFSITNIIPKPKDPELFMVRFKPPEVASGKATSEMDISLSCFPGKLVTLLQLINYDPSYETSLKAIKALISALEEFQ